MVVAVTNRPRTAKPLSIVASLAATVLAACTTAIQRTDMLASGPCYWTDPAVRFVGPAAGACDRLSLDEWCPGVGPPIVIDTATTAAGSDSLLVVSWNVGIGKGRIREIVDLIRSETSETQPFVLLVQETYSTNPGVPVRLPDYVQDGGKRAGPTPPIEITARELGLSLFYAPSMRNAGTIDTIAPSDRGNAILTNLPMRDRTAYELPFELQRRVAVSARIDWTSSDGSDQVVHMTSTHFDTHGRRPFPVINLVNSHGRERQAEGLLAMLPADTPAILTGDLNTALPFFTTWDFLEPAIGTLKAAYPDPRRRPPGGTAGIGSQLDHIMVRPAPQWFVCYARLDGGKRGSDHHPLAGWIVARASPDRRMAGSEPFTCKARE